MILESQRHLFELPEGITFLNSAYLGPRLRAVSEAGRAGVKKLAAPWTVHAKDFFSPVEEVRALFGGLLNADTDGVALVSAVSYGIAVAASNLPLGDGKRVILLDEQFPSNVYAWHAAVSQRGGQVHHVSRRHGWTEDLLEAIDERAAVVAIPNCHWTDGSFVDLMAVRQAARAHGAALVVDATQSLGAFPLDVSSIQPDFVVAAAYKWLLGPYGMAYLWVAPQHREGTPLEFNWINRVGSEDFSRLVDHRSAYQPGARRFDVGQRSNFTLIPMAAAALSQIGKWGVSNISETIARLTAVIEEEATRRGLLTLPVPERVPHLMGLRFTDGIPPGLVDRLNRASVFVSARGDSIRVSPHLHNTSQDVARLFSVMDEMP